MLSSCSVLARPNPMLLNPVFKSSELSICFQIAILMSAVFLHLFCSSFMVTRVGKSDMIKKME